MRSPYAGRPVSLWAARSLLLAGASTVAASVVAAEMGLFDASEPLQIELALDLGELCRGARSERCADLPATLAYTSSDGVEHRIAVAVRARGRWRNDSGNCAVPPLAVMFAAGAAEGTLFAGQTMLPLTTHCRDKPADYEQYLLKENLAYAIYNELTDKSLRTRLARITYRDSGRRGRSVERYAFFTEHFESLAARHGAQVWPTDDFDPWAADTEELALLEVFEFMIGNTDWSVVGGHNIAHLRGAGGEVSVVAYDFDFSGFVDAPYATPPPQLPIRRVSQRLYRGFCHPGLDWAGLFARFQDRRAAIETAIDRQIDALEAFHRMEARAYVGDFFDLIASPERRQADIVGACRPLADRL